MNKGDWQELYDNYPPQPAVPEELPRPSLWPIVLAMGTLFLFWGFVTSLAISATGLLLMVISVAGWIQEFRS